jgi:hypothetical protein
MCIIVGNIESVSQTKIAVVVKPDNRQLVVYSNRVMLAGNREWGDDAPEAAKPVAMVLPFPNWSGRDVEVVPTKPTDCDVFDALDKACSPLPASMDMFGLEVDDEESFLEVRRSGSYRYSVAATPADLRRADPTVFAGALPADLSLLIEQYAAAQFGFIVCVIDASAVYTPFAYLCDRLPGSGAVFVPTKHYHSHDAAGSADTADWDHSVYVLGTRALICASIGRIGEGARCGVDFLPRGPLMASAIAKEMGKCGASHLSCFRIDSRSRRSAPPNEDMVIEFQ